MLYVGTGEGYTSPAADTSDAVLAFSLATGERQWAKQLLGGDAWNMACFIGEAANCPEEDGPDLDIGASTVLWSGEGARLPVGGPEEWRCLRARPRQGRRDCVA